MEKIKVCLVVVTYNRYKTLTVTLQNVMAQSRPVDYLFVVDNCSDDDTIRRLKEDYSGIEVIKMPSNLGYAAGLASGMRSALKVFDDITFFWLMDDDSHPHPEALELLLEAKAKSKPGILSVTGLNDSLWNGRHRLSTLKDKEKHLIDPSINLYAADHVLIDGALVDRTVVDAVGVPSENFFMMCEDLEYSRRISNAGYQIAVLENESLMHRNHFGGGEKFSRSTLWRGYYHSRNHLMILKKYFSLSSLLRYVIIQSKYLVASLAARDRKERIYLRGLGILHGLMGVSGKTIDPKKYN